MKKLSVIIALSLVAILTSCSNGKSIDSKSIDLKWTAYKTTGKVPVSGTFKEINISNIQQGNTIQESLNGVNFSIPVSSIFSNNESRDKKLQMYFFGVMENTSILEGKLNVTSDTAGSLEVSMNGVTNSFPVEISAEGDLISIAGVINLKDWNALSAVSSLNKACFELHKGADGVSKTWDEVQVETTFSLSK